MYRVAVTEHFDAAHKLWNFVGPCSSCHGHTWSVIVTISGEKLDSVGMLCDFKKIKSTLKNICLRYIDHKYLNEVPPFNSEVYNPTAENLAHWIYRSLSQAVGDAKLESVRVYESPECFAEFLEENDTN